MNYNKKYDWLFDDIDKLKEKIIFRNKIEYRISGKLHNTTGPAIIHKFDPLLLTAPSPEDFEEYYVNGDKIDFEEWIIYNRRHKIIKIKKVTAQKKDIS